MTDIELLVELIDDIARDLIPEIRALSVHELAWQPGLQANSIGVTAWRIARGFDYRARA